jgi:hypothetical protein
MAVDVVEKPDEADLVMLDYREVRCDDTLREFHQVIRFYLIDRPGQPLRSEILIDRPHKLNKAMSKHVCFLQMSSTQQLMALTNTALAVATAMAYNEQPNLNPTDDEIRRALKSYWEMAQPPIFIGTSKYARKVAEQYNKMNNGDDWYYNGCCQFFKTEFLQSNPLNPDCLIEDEEIYWRILKRKLKAATLVIGEPAYTEAPDSPRKEFHQRLRWARGSMQLVRTKSMPRRYAPIPFFSILVAALAVAAIFSHVNAFPALVLAVALPVWFLTSHPKALNGYSFVMPLIDDIVFFEAVFFKRKYSVKDWSSAS